LPDEDIANIFSHSVGGLFSLETISFIVQKLFNFIKFYLSILCLSLAFVEKNSFGIDSQRIKFHSTFKENIDG
jgi:hypothetical protein